MKRPVVLVSLAAVFAACTPDVPYTAPGEYVTALFDPSQSVVPTPTILAYDPVNRRLAVPIAESASPAQREFVTFLNSLDGYPEDTPGKVSFSGDLDPSSVRPNTVLILDGTTGAPIAGAAAVLSAPRQINIIPPAAGWPAGRLIAVALVAGDNGLKGATGKQVVGSAVWGLVKSSSPLVTGCSTLFLPDGSPNPQCQPTVSIIPSNETDPAARLQDQSHSAVLLEQIRLVTAPILAALEARNIPRDNVPLAWAFPVTARPQVTFDPARSIIPFPNDVLRTTLLPDGGRLVSLPIPDGGSPEIVALYGGLNTLDGFSTTAPLVSVFNGDDFGALNQGKIDAGSLVPGSGWGFSRLAGNPGHVPTDAGVTACLDCRSSPLLDGGTPDHPQRLQFVPNVPLDERTTYGVYLTTNITDTAPQPHKVIPSSAFALLRSENPLYDGTKSTVDLITDDQAKQLEPLRLALNPFITRVASAVGGRSNIALAWAFTTQTEVTALAGLNALPANLGMQFPAQFPANPIFLVPTAVGSRTYRGEIITPQVLNGPGGTLSPGNPTPKKAPVSVQVPIVASCPVPVDGYSVTIFGHDLTRTRADGVLALAPALTASPRCQVVIATDVVWHGDRSFCAGSLPFLKTIIPAATSDDDACVVRMPGPTPGKCDENPMSESFGRCIALNPATRAPCNPLTDGDQFCSDPSRSQGLCLSDGFCEGGDFKRPGDIGGFDLTRTPLISGWNILNLTNLFATRDNFRQQVVDLAQLTRVISARGTGSLNDRLGSILGTGTTINYAGQGLGGILGTLYTSVSPDVHNVVLNAPGGDPATILLLSRAFTPQRNAFLATLAGQGIHPGEIGFDTFVGTAKWIFDPADPLNMIFSVRNGPSVPSGSRNALIQWIMVDEVIPNETTEELISAANDRSGTFNMVETFLFNPTETEFPPSCTPDGMCNPSVPPRHGFLLQSPPTDPISTPRAQCQVANYVTTGSIGSCP